MERLSRQAQWGGGGGGFGGGGFGGGHGGGGFGGGGGGGGGGHDAAKVRAPYSWHTRVQLMRVIPGGAIDLNGIRQRASRVGSRRSWR